MTPSVVCELRGNELKKRSLDRASLTLSPDIILKRGLSVSGVTVVIERSALS